MSKWAFVIFSETTGPIGTKFGSNVHWRVLKSSHMCIIYVPVYGFDPWLVIKSANIGRIHCSLQMKERNPLYLKLQSRLQIISFPGSILSTCHLWKCRYRVYWNISYPLSILKVIFLKSNPETLILPLERGCNPTLCYGKCWPNILSKATFNKTNFWFIFSHFCYIKS